MSRAPWIDEVTARSVAEMAEAVALERVKGNSWACPACQARTRHASRQDRRGAIGQTRGGRGWACHTCGAKGDALDLAAFVGYGKRLADLEQEQRRELRERLTGMGLCTGRTSYQQAPIRAQRPVVELPPEPEGPSPEEVGALWDSCQALTFDRGAVRYCQTRGWGRHLPHLVEQDVLRITPEPDAMIWPEWWPQWRARCWRMVAPMWSCTGELLGLHGRAVGEPPPRSNGEPMPKALGHRMRGRAWFMCPRALEALQGAGLRQAIMVEGVADFWALAGWCQAQGLPYAVLGGVSGSFAAAGDLPWTDGAELALMVHEDEAGDRYAVTVAQALAGQAIKLKRVKLNEVDDG